jgi:pimeloyl-ACP methyl ester carboxylesterase
VSEESRIYYNYHGGGDSRVEDPPLVFIHGAGGSHLHWPSELRRMPGVQVYSLDLPGHGKSKSDAIASIKGYAHKLLEWLDSVELGSAVLVGHSMGGAISLTLCLEAPHRIKGLVLVGSGAKLRVSPQLLALSEDEGLYQQATQLVMQWAFSANADDRLVDLAQKRMSEVPATVIHSDFLACDKFDIMDRLTEISVPTLVLCGEEDQMTPVKYSQYLAENIPHARLVVIKDAGHMVMLEKPFEVTRAIGDFLQELNSKDRNKGG